MKSTHTHNKATSWGRYVLQGIMLKLLILVFVISFPCLAEDEVPIKATHHPIGPMIFAGLTSLWMVHEGGRNPELARNFYSIGLLVGAVNFQENPEMGALVLGYSSTMVATNQYYIDNPEEESIVPRQANLKAFTLSLMIGVGISNLLGDKLPEEVAIKGGNGGFSMEYFY